jgi:hypothetical protein
MDEVICSNSGFDVQGVFSWQTPENKPLLMIVYRLHNNALRYRAGK